MSDKLEIGMRFSLSDDTVVTNDTVKISVIVSALIDGVNITNDNLGTAVKNLLNSFIESDWAFSNPVRKFETGIEKATFQAYTRINAEQNYDLEARAQKLNAKGIQINVLGADSAIPAYMIKAAESKLRLTLLALIDEEIALINAQQLEEYWLGGVSFATDDGNYSKNMRATAASSYSVAADNSGAIGNSEKVAMTAQVVLYTSDLAKIIKKA